MYTITVLSMTDKKKPTEKQKNFALYVLWGMSNWAAAGKAGYHKNHSGRIRRSRGVELEVGRIRKEMIDKTHFTKEFMIEKLYTMMGKMESALGRSDDLEPKDQRESMKVALEIGREINKMLGHYTPNNSQHLRVEGSAGDMSALLDKIEKS